MSQLTITLGDDILQAAQEYAHRQGQELNAWVAQVVVNAIKPAALEPAASSMPLSQRLALVHKLAGSLKAPADFDYKKELEEGLAEKYGV